MSAMEFKDSSGSLFLQYEEELVLKPLSRYNRTPCLVRIYVLASVGIGFGSIEFQLELTLINDKIYFRM